MIWGCLQWDSDCCTTDLHYPSSQPMIPGQDDLFGEATDSGAEPMHEPSGAFGNQQTQPRKTSRFTAVNRDKPDRWKDDIRQSVDLYNRWFMRFAPAAFRAERIKATKWVEDTLEWTQNLRDVSPTVLKLHPGILPTLRMACCPPLARDRLIGLSSANSAMVRRMELEKSLPIHVTGEALNKELVKIGTIIQGLADRDIFSWLDTKREPSVEDIRRAASIVADRLCGA